VYAQAAPQNENVRSIVAELQEVTAPVGAVATTAPSLPAGAHGGEVPLAAPALAPTPVVDTHASSPSLLVDGLSEGLGRHALCICRFVLLGCAHRAACLLALDVPRTPQEAPQ
jgi:hypothetical protein